MCCVASTDACVRTPRVAERTQADESLRLCSDKPLVHAALSTFRTRLSMWVRRIRPTSLRTNRWRDCTKLKPKERWESGRKQPNLASNSANSIPKTKHRCLTIVGRGILLPWLGGCTITLLRQTGTLCLGMCGLCGAFAFKTLLQEPECRRWWCPDLKVRVCRDWGREEGEYCCFPKVRFLNIDLGRPSKSIFGTFAGIGQK